MKSDCYWNLFLKSGQVDVYLKYKNLLHEENDRKGEKVGTN